jgi:cytochrome c oxidase assembly protein subunit 11
MSEEQQDRQEKQEAQQEQTRRAGALSRLNAKTLGKLAVIVVLMVGFAYALGPVYRQICEATGINVLTQKEEGVQAAPKSMIDASRWVTVEFDANTTGPWRFRPVTNKMQVHPGEMNTVLYEVVNEQSRKLEAQAIPSYAPHEAEKYFKKIECFCFKQQTLEPNEARQMPVLFYIDPKLPKSVTTITLSYTFFEVK